MTETVMIIVCLLIVIIDFTSASLDAKADYKNSKDFEV